MPRPASTVSNSVPSSAGPPIASRSPASLLAQLLAAACARSSSPRNVGSPSSATDDREHEAVDGARRDPRRVVRREALEQRRPHRRQHVDERRQQHALGEPCADEVARAMQRGDRLAGARPAAHARRAVGDVADDPRLRRVQVEHPLLDRAPQHELEVARVELGDRVRGLGRAQALGELGLVDARVLGRRRAAAVEDREVAVGVVPHVGDELDVSAAHAELGERLADLDVAAIVRIASIASGVEPDALQLRRGEHRQRVLALRLDRAPGRGASARPRARASGGASGTSVTCTPSPRRWTTRRSRCA